VVTPYRRASGTRTYLGKTSGVTLIELLIAITLVSLLSVGMLFAIRVGLDALERTNTRMMANRRVLGAKRAIDQQIRGLIPVQAFCAGGPAGLPANARMVFFQGDPRSMRFLSSHSLEEASRGYPRIVEYAVIPGREAGVRLIVNERLYTGPDSLAQLCLGMGPDPMTGQPSLRFRPVEPTPRSFVLADRLSGCRLSYRTVDPKTREPVWLPAFSGVEPPSAVRVEMTPLQPDPSRLHLATTTVPIRVTRSAVETYKDIDDPDPQ
jgi:prepilin-type N-terminal cleavage/methylation domain-containing protein